MKLHFLLLLLLFQSCGQADTQTQAPPADSSSSENAWMLQDLIQKWENNKTYTITVVNAMPEEHFDFQPTEDMRTFREQASHIAANFKMLMKRAEYDELPELNDNSKNEMIASFNTLFDEIIGILKSMNGSLLEEEVEMWYGDSSKSRIINLMDNHMAHHRGQMIVYLRLKDIEPPSYVGW